MHIGVVTYERERTAPVQEVEQHLKYRNWPLYWSKFSTSQVNANRLIVWLHSIIKGVAKTSEILSVIPSSLTINNGGCKDK